MLNSPILEVAIGMIFFYLLLSLICTALNEVVEASLKNRAQDLENGIRRLLDGTVPIRKRWFQRSQPIRGMEGAGSLAENLYDHALVRGLYLDRKNLPSYIPARNFALALMDLIAPQGAKGATLSSPVSTTNSVVVVNAQQQTPPSQLAGAANSAAAIDALRKGINDSVASDAVKRGLLALVDASGSDAAKLRENIENWYNSSMDRVAGWYKRRIQWIILALGVLLAVVLNADSVIVSQALWKNAALRSGVVKAAEDLNAHYVKTSSLPATSDTSAAPADQSTLTPEQQGEQYNRKLQSLGLPIGWNNQDEAHRLPDGFLKSPVHFLSLSVHQLDLHWLGWLITGLAISLGAPFWFDLLNKIIVVRSTVKPREKSPDEASKA